MAASTITVTTRIWPQRILVADKTGLLRTDAVTERASRGLQPETERRSDTSHVGERIPGPDVNDLTAVRSQREPLRAPETPFDVPTGLDDARNLAAEVMLQRWGPRHQGESEPVIDHGEAT